MTALKLVTRWLLGLLFMLAGANHFLHPDIYVRIMPPYLPWHLELVYLSGVGEIVLGTLLLVPRCAALAAWGLIALLIAVFPANLHMALNSDQFADLNPLLLWLRLPLQGVLIAWTFCYTDSRIRAIH